MHRPESRAVIGVPALSLLAMRPALVQRFRTIEEGSGQRLAFIVASTLRSMASPPGFNLPPRAVAATSPTSKIAAALSFVCLAVLALLAVLVLYRRAR